MPFFLKSGQAMNINYTRMLEALIIAAVISLAGYLLALPVIKSEMQAMRKELNQLNMKFEKMHDDIYKPVFRQRVR